MFKLSAEQEREIDRRVKEQNDLEDKLALERFGVTWEELDYDDKEDILYEVEDLLGIGLD